MSEPCQQSVAIGQINHKVDELTKVLQTVAEQKVEIKHLIEGQGNHRKWLLTHQERIEKIERWQSSLTGAQKLLLAVPSLLTAANVVLIWLTWTGK